MLQVMMIGAAVLAVGAGVMKMSQTQTKENSSLTQRAQMAQFVGDLKNIFKNPVVCKNTLAQNGTLTAGMSFAQGIKDQVGLPMYRIVTDSTTETEINSARSRYIHNGGYVIKDLKLLGFTPASGTKLSKAQLEVTLKPYRNNSENTSFSMHTKKEFIELMLITRDNNVELCMSNLGDNALTAYAEACRDFKGTMDPATGMCMGISENVSLNVEKDLCSPLQNKSCVHPFKGKTCRRGDLTDLRGTAHQNWVVDGFTTSGELVCSCVPRPCPSTTNVCFGLDLGTDHCDRECPRGTLTNDTCCPWGASPASTCLGTSFTQSNGCGNTRTNTGTAPIVWTPSVGTVCSGANFTQTKTCDGTTRAATGTQAIVWSPSTNTICAGSSFTQTRSCDGLTRSTSGTRDCTCYGGVYGPGCRWPNGTLGDTTSFTCNNAGASGGRCRADCMVDRGIIKWTGSNTCSWTWNVSAWGSCRSGTKTRSVTCPFPGFCAGGRPASSSTAGCAVDCEYTESYGPCGGRIMGDWGWRDCTQNCGACSTRYQPVTIKVNRPASGGGKACPKSRRRGKVCGGHCHCFIAGTKISMSDGSYKKIEDVKVGDTLIGSNGNINKVLKLKPSPHRGLKYSINGSDYFVTEGHPFMTLKGWSAFNPKLAMKINPSLHISILQVGDFIVKDNSYEEVLTIGATDTDEDVFNFELDGSRDYFANGFLVHNK